MLFGPASTSVSLANTFTGVAASSSVTDAASSTAVGGSSTSVTVTVNTRSRLNPPESVTRTRTDNVGVVSWSKEPAVRNDPASTTNRALSPDPAPATNPNDAVSPTSGSTSANTPTTVPAGRFSATDTADKLRSVGARS